MSENILNKLNTLLGNRGTELFNTKPVFEEEVFDRMFEFITSLNPDQLSEDQASEVVSIVEDVELEYDGIDEDYDDLDEAKLKVRHNKAEMRARRLAYKKAKAARKMAARKYKKSAQGRLMLKKAARMAKSGKTATGRRQRMFV
jgi:hypothetical protein